MRFGFVHDHKFIERDDVVYSTGGLSRNAWHRFNLDQNNVVVISRGLRSNYTKNLVISSEEGVEFILLNGLQDKLDYILKIWYIISAVSSVVQKVDIVVVRLPSVLGLFGAFLSRYHRKVLVVEVVGCPKDALWNYGGFLPKVFSMPYYFLMHRIVNKSNNVLYVTQHFLQKRYPPSNYARTVACSNVELFEFASENDVRNKYNRLLKRVENNMIHLGMIANISIGYKGFDVIIKALKVLDTKGVKYRMSFVGSGSPIYLEDLIERAKLKGQVEILGSLKSGKPIVDFLNNIDILVHPSKQEGLPRVVIEAMSRGCYVLASSIAGTPELLDKSCLHPPGSDSVLFKQLYSLVVDNASSLEIMLKNLQRSKEYSYERLNDIRKEFYAKVQ